MSLKFVVNITIVQSERKMLSTLQQVEGNTFVNLSKVEKNILSTFQRVRCIYFQPSKE